MQFGIVGVTGAVGAEMLRLLDESTTLPISNIRLFASERSEGRSLHTSKFGDVVIEKFTLDSARETDILFLAVSGTFSLEFAERLVEKNGPIVIDNSSAWRYHKTVPLVIPEINGTMAVLNKSTKLIANPNCTTAVAAMALWPIHCEKKIKKMIVSTYQAASGAGVEGMHELWDQCGLLSKSELKLSGKFEEKLEPKVFAHPLAYNLIPQIDVFQENGYTKEEMKVVWETRKIFRDESIQVSVTAVRVPTLRAHAESITIETEKEIDPNEVRNLLRTAKGVEVVDEPGNKRYPMPHNASSKNDVEVGRIRQNLIFGKHGLDLFVCGDQLLRGAALNAILIAEKMIELGLVTPKET